LLAVSCCYLHDINMIPEHNDEHDLFNPCNSPSEVTVNKIASGTATDLGIPEFLIPHNTQHIINCFRV